MAGSEGARARAAWGWALLRRLAVLAAGSVMVALEADKMTGSEGARAGGGSECCSMAVLVDSSVIFGGRTTRLSPASNTCDHLSIQSHMAVLCDLAFMVFTSELDCWRGLFWKRKGTKEATGDRKPPRLQFTTQKKLNSRISGREDAFDDRVVIAS